MVQRMRLLLDNADSIPIPIASTQSYISPHFTPLPRSARALALDAKYSSYRPYFARSQDGKLDEFEMRGMVAEVVAAAAVVAGDANKVAGGAVGAISTSSSPTSVVIPTDSDLRSLLHTIQHNTHGEGLTYDEFISVMEREGGSNATSSLNQQQQQQQQQSTDPNESRLTLEAYIAMGGNADESGYIDSTLIKRVISDFGLTINISEILELLDTDGSGKIEYDEFKCLFEEDEELEGDRVNPLSEQARVLKWESEEESEGEEEYDEEEIEDGGYEMQTEEDAIHISPPDQDSLPLNSNNPADSTFSPSLASLSASLQPRPPSAPRDRLTSSPRMNGR